MKGEAMNVQRPPEYNAPLSVCLARSNPADVREFERRWSRGQMRGWAGHWRRAKLEAAAIGRPAGEVERATLHLAIGYRNAAQEGR